MRRYVRWVCFAAPLIACSAAKRDAPPETARSTPSSAPSSDSSSAPSARAPSASVASQAPPAPAPSDDSPLAWGTRPARDGVLFPVVDGMCIHGETFQVENGAVFAYGMALPHTAGMSRGWFATAAVLTDRGLSPQAGQGFGKAFNASPPLVMGGTLPDKLFVLLDQTGRMHGATSVSVGRVDSAEWREVFASPTGPDGPYEIMDAPLPLGDAGYLFPTRLEGTSITHSFRVLGRDLVAARAAKVSGADLATAAFEGGIVRIASGELLGLSSPAKDHDADLKLVRWSPDRPVNDLPLPRVKNPSSRAIRAGSARAFIRLDDTILSYDGAALKPAGLSSRPHAAIRDYGVGADDTLVVETMDGALLRELPTGEIKESKVPVVGALHGVRQGSLWLRPDGREGVADRLFRELPSGAWEEVPLPEPPYAMPLRSPLKVEGVTVLAKDDVLVNVRRLEKGWGWREAEYYRAIYRTKRPAEVMRCQDTRDGNGSGVGLYSWPPEADDACKTPFVVLMFEVTHNPKNDYPSLRATLRGRKELGARVDVVEFAGRGMSNTGFAVERVADARVLATDLSRDLDLRADVVCGAPVPTSTRTLDVARGVFVSPPAK